ncbi:ADP-heptose:LPS heptosyltransferase II [Crenothrix polyspora]|uniref:lipopolysaccharide heptosyltransferase II n=1 Tax=Crenothrix polyspora TaxID=360316 RepID=A0A1R4HA36_9GAMM|nr:ADP-heptose:LPS heptosyltransferase II [Crenothrix polyspora]
MGDMVMAQSLFIALKDQYPLCQIDVLAPKWTLALLAKMPQVQHAIALPTARGQFGLIQRYQLGRRLRSEHYDQAIVLPNSWKSALVPFFAYIPVRTGYMGECRWGLLNDARTLDKSVLAMTVQRFVALAYAKNTALPPACPTPCFVSDNSKQHATALKFQLNLNLKILVLCPGAEYGEAKRWPISHFAELAKQTAAQGWQIWLLGSDKDSAIAEQINHAAGNVCRNFAGHTSLTEAVELMALADAIVSNDSGLMHVAAALDKDIVALYGSSDPSFTPPLSKKAHIISLQLACSPCFKRECPLYPPEHESHTQCLTNITPDRVLTVLSTIH